MHITIRQLDCFVCGNSDQLSLCAECGKDDSAFEPTLTPMVRDGEVRSVFCTDGEELLYFVSLIDPFVSKSSTLGTQLRHTLGN